MAEETSAVTWLFRAEDVAAAVAGDHDVARTVAPAAQIENEPHDLDAAGLARHQADDVGADLARPLGTGDEADVAALGVELLLAAVRQAADGAEYLAVGRQVLLVVAVGGLAALGAVIYRNGRDGPADAVAREGAGIYVGC